MRYFFDKVSNRINFTENQYWMKVLLKNAKVFNPGTSYHGKRFDIQINKGKIEKIAKGLSPDGYREIKSKNLCVSPGWLDLGAQVFDPGFEHREDIQSLSKAAAKGGFTALAPFPNTQPVLDNKSGVQYLINRAKEEMVDFYPLGAITAGCGGMEITEMYDMREAGAIAFSDGKASIQHSGVLLRALQYVKAFDGVIINKPQDETLSAKGQMHEGSISTVLGMKGIPDVAEVIQVQRDISILEYAESRLHLAHLSAKDSISLVKKAKKQGLKVTASTPVMNLFYEDTDLETFETNLKVSPPLRNKKDQKALKKGLAEGIIDFIASNHTPLEPELKDLEFPYAKPGAVTLEFTFALANTATQDFLSTEELVDKFVSGARKVLNLPIPTIEEGSLANLTVFDPDVFWTANSKDIVSKSKNSPMPGLELKGKVLGIINKGKTNL